MMVETIYIFNYPEPCFLYIQDVPTIKTFLYYADEVFSFKNSVYLNCIKSRPMSAYHCNEKYKDCNILYFMSSKLSNLPLAVVTDYHHMLENEFIILGKFKNNMQVARTVSDLINNDYRL